MAAADSGHAVSEGPVQPPPHKGRHSGMLSNVVTTNRDLVTRPRIIFGGP
jgi:hypothetical protein